MSRKEEQVYNAVQRIINRRKAAGKYPECALTREITDEMANSGIDRYELTGLLMNLVKDGKLSYRPAINDQSYYINSNNHGSNS